MNDVFTVTSQITLLYLGHKDRKMSLKAKVLYTILGTKACTLEQLSKFCYFEYVKW